MKRSIKSLIGFTLSATDGAIGKVKEFYFDEHTWTIRYMVVDRVTWLSGRAVLISTEALLSVDWANKTFLVDLNRDQIKNSPDINTNEPVSRQEEIKLNSYYAWEAYWGTGYYGKGPTTDLKQEILEQSVGDENRQLRSTYKVSGYSITASNGKIGDVQGFLMDDLNWKIIFILVDTGHWLPGKKVLLSPDLIKKIDWKTASVILNTTVEHVKQSPEYDPDQELTEAYTLALNDHYKSPVT
ncbi:PRC-barrel domain-containing protein [Marivirga sp.]|uniref:PRC-barrel domain-containing protein n=1 Tax=Marivirga sp. TaxID=2018662 RepID=UPI0025E87CF2|nr:PRC-barrel domain-containing protein [Marivirga sp.]